MRRWFGVVTQAYHRPSQESGSCGGLFLFLRKRKIERRGDYEGPLKNPGGFKTFNISP